MYRQYRPMPLAIRGGTAGVQNPRALKVPPSFGGWEDMRNSARGSNERAQPQNCGGAHSLLIRQKTKQNG
jgi:hypothetical protein